MHPVSLLTCFSLSQRFLGLLQAIASREEKVCNEILVLILKAIQKEIVGGQRLDNNELKKKQG